MKRSSHRIPARLLLSLAFIGLIAAPALAEDLQKLYPATMDWSKSGLTWTCTPDDVWELKSFEFEHGKDLKIACKKSVAALGVHKTNVLWAVVTDDDPPFEASLVRAGQPQTTVTEAGNGVIVDFGRSVAECAWTATKGAPDANSPGLGSGQATVEGVTGNPSGVQVEVTNSGGAALDDPFHLMVVC